MLIHPLLAENSLFALIGKIFHPLFELFGYILAGLYAVWPNYGFAITGLTVIIMLALTPVTVKSTKSMLAMQRLQPEMKKLQAKYKGPENREMLNQEMMKLYKENGTSPFGACLPSLLQMPFLIVLYSLIRGLSYVVPKGSSYTNAMGQTIKCTVKAGCASPRYIPTHSQMHDALVASNGQMHWWFGMDLSSLPLSHHAFPGSASQAVLVLHLHREGRVRGRGHRQLFHDLHRCQGWLAHGRRGRGRVEDAPASAGDQRVEPDGQAFVLGPLDLDVVGLARLGQLLGVADHLCPGLGRIGNQV